MYCYLPITPKLIDNKQDQSTPGGWAEVLKYCERPELKDIFVENDYLIIQIDSDQSQTKPFDVSHTNKNNKTKTVEELHKDVMEKLTALIQPQIWAAYSDKIYFAICIHTIECWLLPIYYSGKKKINPSNCIKSLNTELSKDNLDIIPLKEKNNPQGVKAYDGVLKNWKRKQDIIDSAQYDAAFKKFIDSL